MTGRIPFLALTSVLLLTSLLPSAQGLKCKEKDPTVETTCTNEEAKVDYCVKKWTKNGVSVSVGCNSEQFFEDANGFAATEGCGEVTGSLKDDDAYACACSEDICNDDKFGEEDYRKWKEGGGGEGDKKDGVAPLASPPRTDEDDKGGSKKNGGSSSGLVLSNFVQVTLAALAVCVVLVR